MQIDDFLELARRRRSIRRFKPDPIPDEDIKKILEAARWAMSGANAQPWEFVIIKDQETKERMVEALSYYREMNSVVEQIRVQELRHPGHRTGTPEIAWGNAWGNAPVIIAVLGDVRTMQASSLVFRFFEHHTVDQNLANATHMMHLAAATLGLGARWVALTQPMGEALKPILGVPPVIRVFTLIPIGYPAYQPTSMYRRVLSELVHYEKYDMSRFREQKDIQEYIKHLRQQHEALKAYP